MERVGKRPSRLNDAVPPHAGGGPAFGLALLFCAPLFSQTLTGPALAAACPGTVSWDMTNDPAMATAPYTTLQYASGKPFTCTIPIATPGLVSVSVLLEEPTKTGPGQRLFTVTANGQQSAPLDLFGLTGGIRIAYEVDFWFVAQHAVTLTFTPSIWNAVVAGIVVLPPPMTTGQNLWNDPRNLTIWRETYIGILYLDTDGLLKFMNGAGAVAIIDPTPVSTAAAVMAQWNAAISRNAKGAANP